MSPVVALAAFWFLYMAAIGLLFPFFALYLGESAGLSGTEVGAVVAMIPLVGLAAPTVWGRIADRSGRGGRVLALALLGASAGQVALGVANGFWALLFATAFASAFLSAIVPLSVSVSLDVLGETGPFRFGRVRAWGTVGYLVAVVGFPLVLHAARVALGVEPGLRWMFPAGALLTLAAANVLRTVASEAEVSAPPRADWRELLRHPAFLRMLLFAFLAFLFLQGPMSLFPIWVRAQGGGVEDLSLMWVLMLLPEIPLMVLAGPGLRRFGARPLLAGGVAAGAVRWLVCGLVDDPFWRYAAQTLHGATVTGLLIGSPLYVDASVPPALRATAQGVLSMAGAGVGGILSVLATGWVHDHASANAPYWLGGGGALVLACLVTLIVPPPERSDT